jgi:hypothetical protein
LRAPIDLEHSTSCTYCGSAIAILDADTVQEAMRIWAAEDARARTAQAEAAALAQSIYGSDAVQPGARSPAEIELDPIANMQAGGDLLQVCLATLKGIKALRSDL